MEKDKAREAAIQVLRTVSDAIKELTAAKGGVPSGELYAQLMGFFSLATYRQIVDVLVAAKLVEEHNHFLTWVGPA